MVTSTWPGNPFNGLTAATGLGRSLGTRTSNGSGTPFATTGGP
ncbi:hypothetical protein [Nonomuraea sp. NPDC050783]